MDDLEIRARRAGAAAREEADARLAQRTAPAPAPAAPLWRPPTRIIAAAATAVVAVVALVVWSSGSTVRTPMIDPALPPADPEPAPAPTEPVAEDSRLPVPDVGDALAAYLEDGRPVFVSHPVDGEVVVLDALDPRAPWGWERLVAYCGSSGWFEEVRHGSRFNGWGEWTGGPSPGGLGRYPSELAANGESVRITGPMVTSGRLDAEDRRQQSPQGPSCADAADAAAAGGGALVQHEPPAEPVTREVQDIPGDRWVWARLVVGGTAASPVVCAADGSCPPDAPAVAGIDSPEPDRLLGREPRTMLARTLPDGSIELVLPATDEEGPNPGIGHVPNNERLLTVPTRGQAVAAFLRDQTPVWVVHDLDGQVHVLAATSGVAPALLTAWCPAEDLFVDSFGRRYEPDGRPTAGDHAGLAPYPTELVDFGDARGVRVVGSPGTGLVGPGGMRSQPSPTCHGAVRHEPQGPVYEPGLQVSDESWQWVRMRIEVVEGALYLCAGSDQPCGAPADPDSGTTPYRDPVVVTPGVEPSDEPQLMLVRGRDRGREVEVRLPPTDLP